MRLWSLHPKYLDTKGLVALWREGLLALEVLKGNTKGYINHPQLLRFRATTNPIQEITKYLWNVYFESVERGYQFNKNKLEINTKCSSISVTRGQLNYEMKHLKNKLKNRDKNKYKEIKSITIPIPNPLFNVVDGKVEEWEKVIDKNNEMHNKKTERRK